VHHLNVKIENIDIFIIYIIHIYIEVIYMNSVMATQSNDNSVDNINQILVDMSLNDVQPSISSMINYIKSNDNRGYDLISKFITTVYNDLNNNEVQVVLPEIVINPVQAPIAVQAPEAEVANADPAAVPAAVPAPVLNNPSDLLVNLIDTQYQKQIVANIWTESKYKNLPDLKSNNIGNVGENLLQNICMKNNIVSTIDGTKTKKRGGGDIGDGKIKNKSVEIKTAHLGSDQKSFQHELGEHPWTADYIAFIDVAPTVTYITIFKNFTEEQYKNIYFKCDPYYPTKSITRRKKEGNFKLDTSPDANEFCVSKGYSIKITDATTYVEVGTYINRIIV